MRLKDKVVIVTGGARGIGQATSLLFAKEGAKVVVSDIRVSECKETVSRIVREGGVAMAVKGDVSREKDAKRIVDRTVQVFGRIDVLFNNAGIMPEACRKAVTDVAEKAWDKVIDVNLKSVFLMSKQAIPIMIKNGGGVIINMSSTHGHTGARNRSVYNASKGGVTLLTKSMALDYAQNNIRVNCIGPAAVDTLLTGDLLKRQRKDKKAWNQVMSQIPLRRLGTPSDVAYAALFLASDESSFITGSSLMVDGGYTAQ